MNRKTLLTVTALTAAFSASASALAQTTISTGPVSPGNDTLQTGSLDRSTREVITSDTDVDTGGTVCPADADRDNKVTYNDLFIFLGRYFAGDAVSADMNRDGKLSSGDIFEYIAHFVAGC